MASIILGIIGLFFVLIGLIPLLGIMNWLGLPLLVIGLAFGITGIVKNKRRGANIAGTIICGIFMLIGTVRLIVGVSMMTDAAKKLPDTIEKLNDLSDSLDDLSKSLGDLSK